MTRQSYILAASRPWYAEAFVAHRDRLPGHWSVVLAPGDLVRTAELVQPRYIFFPHWSDIVPDALLVAVDCVCFHMTDLPYGRGGSPLQNLILRGHTQTVLTALRMTSELDAGPIYLKRPLSLAGTAGEIYERAAALALSMMAEIVADEPTPVPQTGEVSVFRRRKPAQSVMPGDTDLAGLHDHIRMLDAPGYPHAFIDHGPWRVTFTGATRGDGALDARARIERRKEDT